MLYMESVSNRTIIVSLFFSVIISFGAGYTFFVVTRKTDRPVAKVFHHKNPTTRLNAVQSVSSKTVETQKDLLFGRLTDRHHYVKARAAEACYRMGLSKDIPTETLGECLTQLSDDTVLTKRWIIANVIAINYESGFNLFASELKTIKSPYSRMFLAQILALHASNNKKAKTFIAQKCKESGAERAIARMVRRMLKNDRSKWFKSFFPPSLVIKEIPVPTSE